MFYSSKFIKSIYSGPNDKVHIFEMDVYFWSPKISKSKYINLQTRQILVIDDYGTISPLEVKYISQYVADENKISNK